MRLFSKKAYGSFTRSLGLSALPTVHAENGQRVFSFQKGLNGTEGASAVASA
ncbi:hypothetical protein [Caballeronia sp. AZ10_KS36]|uniref:hypothetical protein n=1 Tax=Caballeronia sp. AZ10_KS36 TaxID=2921757 RepID=UPI0020298D6C|nr:hypothetical protein [Caballeronia sp. AZ10_KS36]